MGWKERPPEGRGASESAKLGRVAQGDRHTVDDSSYPLPLPHGIWLGAVNTDDAL
jgi:hypothetical protein